MSAKDNQKTNPAKTNSVDSIPDAEVPKLTAAEKKKPVSDKMKEEAKQIAQLMAEQEKEAKGKQPSNDSESCHQMKKLIGESKPINQSGKEAKQAKKQ